MYQIQSHRIKVHNSQVVCGVNCTTSLAVVPSIPRHTTRRAMAWSSVFTAALKLHSKPGSLDLAGWMNCLLFSWVSVPRGAPALLTYGTNLRIPGDFFSSTSAERISPSSIFVRDLQENFRKLSPLSPVHHGSENIPTTRSHVSGTGLRAP